VNAIAAEDKSFEKLACLEQDVKEAKARVRDLEGRPNLG